MRVLDLARHRDNARATGKPAAGSGGKGPKDNAQEKLSLCHELTMKLDCT